MHVFVMHPPSGKASDPYPSKVASEDSYQNAQWLPFILVFTGTYAKLRLPLDKYTIWISHYENTPIQIYRKFHLQKLKMFR